MPAQQDGLLSKVMASVLTGNKGFYLVLTSFAHNLVRNFRRELEGKLENCPMSLKFIFGSTDCRPRQKLMNIKPRNWKWPLCRNIVKLEGELDNVVHFSSEI